MSQRAVSAEFDRLNATIATLRAENERLQDAMKALAVSHGVGESVAGHYVRVTSERNKATRELGELTAAIGMLRVCPACARNPWWVEVVALSSALAPVEPGDAT